MAHPGPIDTQLARSVANAVVEEDSPDTPDGLGDCLASFETSDYDSLMAEHRKEHPQPTAPVSTTTQTLFTATPLPASDLLPDPPSPRSTAPADGKYPLESPTHVPDNWAALQWSEQTLDQLLAPSYWRTMCPHLHIESEYMRGLCSNQIGVSAERLSQLRDDMDYEGFFTMDRAELPWTVETSAIALGVVKLMQYGWPPPFILLFDEPWVMAAQLSNLIKETTGNETIMDWFAWYVDPALGGKGWVPHRDRAEAEPSKAFRPDGSSTYTTVWLPMTDATPDNSCLHFVPAYADPGYKDSALDGKEMMDNVFERDYANFQDIRSVPLRSGSLVSFTGRLIHWGSRGKRLGRPSRPPVVPRIAMSFASSCDEFERPYVSRSNLPLPPLALRLALVCSQAIVYNRQERLPKERMALYQRLFMSQHQHFDRSYIEKIEFLCQWFRFASVLDRAPAQLRKQKT